MGWHTNITDISDIDHHLMSSALLPAIVYTAVLMIVGTVGNLLVLIVYRRNFLKSVTRMFIYALAVLDLGNCLVTMPAELAILIRFTSFPDPIWCKVTRYLTFIFNGTSSFILIAIALDRYFKVCRPMRVYITVRKAKIICVTAFCICATLAIPALIIYGELKLRILLSDKGITLYPMEYDLSVINTNTRPGSQPVKRATTLREHTDGFSDDVLTGSFCLLNSKYLNSPVSIIFFIGTCVMYISMVIVVVIFYGKVARAMFILTSKHTRMYSLYNYKNCTPSTNTAFGDVSIARMQRSVDRTNDEVEAEDQQKNQNGNALVCSQKVDEKVCIAETRNKLLEKLVQEHDSEVRNDLCQQGSNVVNGCISSDGSCNSGDIPEVARQHQDDTKSEVASHQQEDTRTRVPSHNEDGTISRTASQDQNNFSIKETLTTKCDAESLKSNGYVTTQAGNEEKEKDTNSVLKSTEKRPLENNTRDAETTRLSTETTRLSTEMNQKLLVKEGMKQTKKSKIPKIKVQSEIVKECNLSQISCNVQPDITHLSRHPISTNSLLNRRIKSADNLINLECFHELRVPNGRGRSHRLRDIVSSDNSKIGISQPSRGDKTVAIGTLTAGNINMDLVTDANDSTLVQDRTLTLTKTSFNGRKRLCVLPLRGMSTKTASQVRVDQTGSNLQNTTALSNTSLNMNNVCDGTNFDLRLDLTQGQCQTVRLTSRSTPWNLNSPDLDSEVKLRTRMPDIVNSTAQPDDVTKTSDSNTKSKVTRKEIISAAELLKEQHKKGSLRPLRTSRTLFIISLVFVISFLPFFVIALSRSSIGTSFMSMTEIRLGVLSVFIRSSLISNAVNPIAYGILSTHFRRECAGIIRYICRK